jgi:hypothetical protein
MSPAPNPARRAARAITAGTVNPGTTSGDVLALVWAMRGLVQATGEVDPGAWQRFLDIHLAGMRCCTGCTVPAVAATG